MTNVAVYKASDSRRAYADDLHVHAHKCHAYDRAVVVTHDGRRAGAICKYIFFFLGMKNDSPLKSPTRKLIKIRKDHKIFGL